MTDFLRGGLNVVEYVFENKVAVVTGGAKGIGHCSYEEFEYAQRVGVTAPFYLTKLFLPYFAPGASIVNISSSRDRMSQPPVGELYRCQGRHRRSDSRIGCQPARSCAGEFHFPRLDRHRLPGI